jgi:hypothetical protein
MGKPGGCKLIRLSGEAEGGRITSISIRGDFFASPEEEFEKIEQGLKGVPVGAAAAAFDALLAEYRIESFGINGRGFAQVLASALAESPTEAGDGPCV